MAGAPVVAGWLALVGVALWWGSSAIAGRGLAINAPPLAGTWGWHASPRIVAPALLAVTIVIIGPRLAAELRWRQLTIISGGAAAAWTLLLAASDGWRRVTEPLATPHEYEPFAADIGSAASFLRDFVERLPYTPIHVQGHPPGAPLVPWLLDRVGLDGAGWFAALVILGWAVAVVAALVAARGVAGETAARRAAPALVLLPAALWAGTSADGLFAGVLAVGVALLVAERAAWAPIGGLVVAAGLLLTYGALALLGIPILVLLRQRRLRRLAIGVGTTVAALAAFWVVTGFSWLDGLAATRAAYHDGVAEERPWTYFALVGNPAALALAIGPAVTVGLVAAVRRWATPEALLPLAGVAVVGAANASLLSKGEVERIWLPFVPWLALAAPGDRRTWLIVQAALALVLQAWLRSKW